MQMMVMKDKVYFSGTVRDVMDYLAKLQDQYVTVRELIQSKLQ